MKCALLNVPSNSKVSVIIIKEKETKEITVIFKSNCNLEKIKLNAYKLNSEIYEFQGKVGDLRKFIKNLKK